MTTKKPALSTQLKQARSEIASLQEQLVKETKRADQNKSYQDMYSEKSSKAEAELETIHSLLDVLPGAIGRKTCNDPEQSWNITTHNVMTRIASYLALR